MAVHREASAAWLLLTFTLPTKRASQRVEIWRKLQRYGTVPLGNVFRLLLGAMVWLASRPGGPTIKNV